MKWVIRAFWSIVIGTAIVAGSFWYQKTYDENRARTALKQQETGYCVAIGGERITDGKCQVGDKIVVITGLDK